MRSLAVLFALTLLAAGDEVESNERAISFQEAVDLGLAYNLGLKSSRLQALIARFDVEEQQATWDTTLTADVGGGEFLTPSRSALAGAPLLDTDAAHVEFGLSKPFRVGPSLGLSWRTDYTFNNSTFATINPAYDSALDLTLFVPLLRGSGREANESELRASQAGAEAARWDLLDEAAVLVERISDAYWNLVYRQDRIEVLEKSVQVAREIEASERRKLRPDIGRSTVLDVTKAFAERKRREVAVIQGELQLADASDELRRLVLPFTGAADDEIGLRAVGIPGDEEGAPGLQEMIDAALVNRPDLRRTDSDLRRLNETVVRARDNVRVQLDLSASVGWKGVNSGMEDSIGDVFSGDAPSVQGAVLLTWPLGRRAARAALRQAELELERAQVERHEQLNGIVIEVRQAHRALRTAMREIEATKEEVRAAAESLAGERKRLDRGSATILDVAQLERNLTEAELRLVQARTDLERARVSLFRASGTLVERYRIELGPELKVKRAAPKP